MKKRPVTFSFASLMAMFAQCTLLNLGEEMDLIYWLTGEDVSVNTVTNAHYERAWAKLLIQFPKNFNGVRFDKAKEELEYMMKKIPRPELRKEWIESWLVHMAARTKMDFKAYYRVKRHYCKK